MERLKTFEEYEYVTDNNKIWIIGIPSGEAFQVSQDAIEDLYREKLIHYNVDYVDIGFFAFKDEDIDDVKKYVIPQTLHKKDKDKEIFLFKNEFNPDVVNKVLNIVEEYPTKIELYIQDKCMGITYAEDFYIEIDLDVTKFKYMKRCKGKVIDKYLILTDKMLLDRIERELYA